MAKYPVAFSPGDEDDDAGERAEPSSSGSGGKR